MGEGANGDPCDFLSLFTKVRMDNKHSGFHRRILSGFAWQGAAKFLIQAVSWASTIAVARMLDPADYGLMAIVGVFVLPLVALMDLGLAQALVQQSALTREEEDAVFSLSLLLGIGLFLLLLFAAPYAAQFYGMPALEGLLSLCACVLILSSLKAVPYALLMRQLDFRSRALVEVTASLISAVAVVILAWAGFGAWSLAWGTLIQQLLVTLGFLPVMGRWPRPTLYFSRISGIVRFGAHVMGANLAYVVSSRADLFLIGKFLGQHLSGIYSLALHLATIPLDKIGSVFNNVAFPALSRVKDDDAQCRALFLEMHRYLIFLAYPILIGLAVVADDLVAVLLGEKWLQLVPILRALCVVNVVRVSGMLMSPALNSRGRSGDAMRYSVAGAIVLPLSFLIGVRFGLEGVALAWVAGYPIVYALLVHYLRRDLGITLTELIDGSRPTLIAATVMAGSVLMFRETAAPLQPWIRLGGSVGIGAVAYAAVFLIFYGEQVARMRKALRTLRSGSSA